MELWEWNYGNGIMKLNIGKKKELIVGHTTKSWWFGEGLTSAIEFSVTLKMEEHNKLFHVPEKF